MLNDYIKEVKSHLECNASDDYKREYITYLYSNDDIDNNLYYFKTAMNNGLSPYKALLFFHYYMLDDYIF